MRIKAKDPRLVSLMGEFMRIYLPGVRNRDKDTIDSYRYSINLFVTYLESKQKVTVLTMQSSDFSQKNIVEFMAWLKSERNNVAPTIACQIYGDSASTFIKRTLSPLMRMRQSAR